MKTLFIFLMFLPVTPASAQIGYDSPPRNDISILVHFPLGVGLGYSVIWAYPNMGFIIDFVGQSQVAKEMPGDYSGGLLNSKVRDKISTLATRAKYLLPVGADVFLGLEAGPSISFLTLAENFRRKQDSGLFGATYTYEEVNYKTLGLSLNATLEHRFSEKFVLAFGANADLNKVRRHWGVEVSTRFCLNPYR